MKKLRNQFKKGAASFYIVAFSTLILLIVATSFATIIISELNRTLNEDLSQSAYDSAMAGVEDAKLAYYSYQNCVANEGGSSDCNTIKSIIDDPSKWNCDMVAQILGRSEGGVMIQESTTNNNMQQEYTCVKIQTVLKDYRSSLSSSDQLKVINAKFENGSMANKVQKIKVSWYDDTSWGRAYSNSIGGKVTFWNAAQKALAVPPTISVAVLQTAENFNLSDFDITVGNKTNRGMLYLVPTNNATAAASNTEDNHYGAWSVVKSENIIGAEALTKSNDKRTTNLPYLVNCPENSDSEFACSATIELPRPITDALNGGDIRSSDTFMVVVSLPYGNPSTNFAVEFLCGDGETCHTEEVKTEEGSETINNNTAYLNGVQIKVDSTGRANDLFRRVETRLQSSADSSYLSIMGPLELLGNNDGSDLLRKVDAVKREWNF
ncbi:MAG: hypothetical protein K6G49_02755 [Candidatus Saccharibacteria bacterium]|nr:hypothetical protein [Candidatus Saccharibacteria bacterium]